MATLSPNKNSNRSKKRAKRGFIDLDTSSRKHRRANKRSAISRYQYGKIGNPGDKVSGGAKSFVHNCGGSIKYHSS